MNSEVKEILEQRGESYEDSDTVLYDFIKWKANR